MFAQVSARRSVRAACAKMFTAAVLVCLLVGAARAVDRSKFKTCDQAGFCHRLRAHNAEAISTNPADAGAGAGAWQIEAASLHFAAAPSSSSSSPAAAHELMASLFHTRYTQQPPLSLRVDLLANGVVRTRVVEVREFISILVIIVVNFAYLDWSAWNAIVFY
jgi:metal-dependent amidase/aminoacylase/carboxypeptidase family protein